MEAWGQGPWIFNLGHGILPDADRPCRAGAEADRRFNDPDRCNLEGRPNRRVAVVHSIWAVLIALMAKPSCSTCSTIRHIIGLPGCSARRWPS